MTEYIYEIDTDMTESSVIATTDSGLAFKSEVLNADFSDSTAIENKLRELVDNQIEAYYEK